MINDEFQKIGLYEHNADSYRKVRDAFDSGKDIVSIVHATGTGKSYNALQLAFDNKDKKIVYVVPSNGIIEHLKKIIEDNPNLSLERDFSNLEFRTYQSLLTPYKEDKMEEIECDILILDEFHHIGAPIWGKTINKLIETHPDIKIFGMTAYTVRDRGTSYERDMANPDTYELFSGTIESRYDLCDAMIDGVLPKPIYKSAYTNLIGMEQKLEERVQKLGVTTKEYHEYMSILNDVKKRIQEAPSIPNILRRSIKQNGKYIYFCPPVSEDGVNDIETIKKQAIEWFKTFIKEEDIIIYTSTSDMGADGRKNRDAFYDDVTLDGENVDNKLRVMFAINQYNEGIHAPNIDGVIMGRGTTSDIVYFEQLGRALSVRGNTKEMFEKLEKYSLEELMNLCKEKDIPVKESDTKEDLIEKLIAPIVIDLTNNYDFIKELENNLKDRVKNEEKEKKGQHRTIKLKDASFDVEMENQDLFEMLRYVSDRLTMTWEDYYELSKKYYEHYGNLEVPQGFKTNDGYTHDENGVIKLGVWINNQRATINPESEKGIKLLQIGMRFNNKFELLWNKWYALAKKYYEEHDNLNVPRSFITETGEKLGVWIRNQRKNIDPESERGKLLSKIGMSFDNQFESLWNKWYALAKKYYEEHGDLIVPISFITETGEKLGVWISKQRTINPESERGKLLSKIGMHFDNQNDFAWNKWYALAKKYYEEHGNLIVPISFITETGEKLGVWINNQRSKIDPESERGKLLSKIGMSFDNQNDFAWNKWYALAKKYYEEHGNLIVPISFITETGEKLGVWISKQRTINPESERGKLLSKIGMSFDNQNDFAWNKWYELAKKYYEEHGDLEVPQNFKKEDGEKLGEWISRQRATIDPESERGKLLSKIGMRFDNQFELLWIKWYELAKKYYEKHNNLIVSKSFVTENGEKLGEWIKNQRSKIDPESERGKLLSKIGMIWNVKKNKEDVKSICQIYGINYDVNKTILDHISVQELNSKIEFLIENNIPIIDEKGILIDIFNMSSPDMKEKYGLTLEEMISKYYVKKHESKGV